MSEQLQAARIPSLPDTAYYIPNFITPEEEERLIQKVDTSTVAFWSRQIKYLPANSAVLSGVRCSPPSLDSALSPPSANMALRAVQDGYLAGRSPALVA